MFSHYFITLNFHIFISFIPFHPIYPHSTPNFPISIRHAAYSPIISLVTSHIPTQSSHRINPQFSYHISILPASIFTLLSFSHQSYSTSIFIHIASNLASSPYFNPTKSASNCHPNQLIYSNIPYFSHPDYA